MKIPAPNGYIALITAVAVSAALLIISSFTAYLTFSSRFNSLDYENKKVSRFLAESCLQTAILKLEKDPNYSPSDQINGDCVGVADGCNSPNAKSICKICSVAGIAQKTVIATANYNQAQTSLSLTINPADPSADGERELPALSGPCASP